MRHTGLLIVFVLILSSIMIASTNQSYRFVGSRNSDVYHYEHCSYVKRILIEDRVYFATRDSAKAMGYRGCRLCKSWRDMNPGELPHGR